MENSAPPPPTEEEPNDSIEAVRDLLFGKRTAEDSGQIAETVHCMADHIHRIETATADRIQILEEMTGERAETIESRIGSIDNHLKSESSARLKQDENQRKNLDQTEADLTERISALEDRVQNFEAKISTEMQSRFKKQAQDLSVLRAELLNRINSEMSTVSENSMGAGDLGAFFIDFGRKIQPVSQSGNPKVAG